jgi:hypothetical protein
MLTAPHHPPLATAKQICMDITKLTFGNLFSEAWEVAGTLRTGKSGFKAARSKK